MSVSSSHDEFQYTYAAWSEAFTIFEKYAGEFNVNAEHDVVYAGPNPDLVSEDDTQRLIALGWHIDSDLNSFYHYT
jgi:hypothetical protein